MKLDAMNLCRRTGTKRALDLFGPLSPNYEPLPIIAEKAHRVAEIIEKTTGGAEPFMSNMGYRISKREGLTWPLWYFGKEFPRELIREDNKYFENVEFPRTPSDLADILADRAAQGRLQMQGRKPDIFARGYYELSSGIWLVLQAPRNAYAVAEYFSGHNDALCYRIAGYALETDRLHLSIGISKLADQALAEKIRDVF